MLAFRRPFKAKENLVAAVRTVILLEKAAFLRAILAKTVSRQLQIISGVPTKYHL